MSAVGTSSHRARKERQHTCQDGKKSDPTQNSSQAIICLKKLVPNASNLYVAEKSAYIFMSHTPLGAIRLS